MIEYINERIGKSQFIANQMQSLNLARALINKELTGIFNMQTLRDMRHTLAMYQVYSEGADFNTDQSSNDWVPAQWHAKQIKGLIDKEARFLFAKPPDISLRDLQATTSDNSRIAANQGLVKAVLDANRFSSKLIRAAKDCLIGKRVAVMVNFNESTGIDVSFVPSLEFVYETDPADIDVMTKFIQFYNVVVNEDKSQQRTYKKKWYMKDGICHVIEELYNGAAQLVDVITPDQPTRLDFIPAAVIINEGLTGDPFGSSDVEALKDTESYFSKLSNKDIDSLRKGTDQITYTIDADPKTTKGLSRAPGAYWDIATDTAKEDGMAQVGTLENPMAYSTALDTTLQRLKASMYSQLDVPDTTGDALQGIVTSGKTMQAIYWGLMVRCDEKMLDWIPGLTHMVTSIIEGAKSYPEIAKRYIDSPVVDGYAIEITNNYPILQDTTEEKASDMMEINAKVLSRKQYLKKWYRMTDEDADKELEQIKFEQSMFDQDSYLLGADEDGGTYNAEEAPEDGEGEGGANLES